MYAYTDRSKYVISLRIIIVIILFLIIKLVYG